MELLDSGKLGARRGEAGLERKSRRPWIHKHRGTPVISSPVCSPLFQILKTCFLEPLRTAFVSMTGGREDELLGDKEDRVVGMKMLHISKEGSQGTSESGQYSIEIELTKARTSICIM